MITEELVNFDSSLEFKTSTDKLSEVLGLTNFDFPKESHLVFLKDAKYLKKNKEKIIRVAVNWKI